MKRTRGVLLRLGLTISSCFLAACGETSVDGIPPAPSETLAEGDDPDAPVGASGVPVRVVGRCEVAAVAASTLQPLDKATFGALLKDYAAGWMAPLHDALLFVDEARVVQAMLETVRGSYEKTCHPPSSDYEFSPPAELIDPSKEADLRAELDELLAEAVEVSSGQVLRLSVHQCSSCTGPLGTSPSFINASLTSDGVLLLEIELEGVPWTRTITLSRDEIAVRANLVTLSDWLDTATEDARAGTASTPDLQGVVFFGAHRADSVWASFSRLRVVGDPGAAKQSTFDFSERCVGMEVQLAPPEVGSTIALDLGTFDIIAPGSTYCPSETSCGPKERSGPFSHHGGGVSLVLEQPPAQSGRDVALRAVTDSESNVSVAGDVFARGGLGDSGAGGMVDVSSTAQADGYLVTFEPALDMGAALAISQFSEEMQLTLPAWLSDEIFDLSFGGAPVPSVRVPMREVCPEDGSSTPVPRREVELLAGSGTLHVGGGRVLSASAGQCVGQSLEDSSTFDLTSDFWEAGFTCQ